MTTPASTPEAHLRIAALAADPRVHRAFHWLHLHESQLRRWQLEFLAIPAPTFAEADRALWFLDRFHSLGLANPHIDSAGNALAELHPQPLANRQNSRVAHSWTASSSMSGEPTPEPPPSLKGTGFSPSIPTPANPGASAPEGTADTTPILLLSAHLDTVFPAATDCTPQADPHTGPIRGPGACDNGAGLTALLAIAAALQHAGLAPACTILFAANTGEEGEGDLHGMKHLFQHSLASPYAHRIRAAIALEGSGSATVVDRGLGSRRLRVTVTGPGGHSWADAGRPNPILALASTLLAAAALPLPANPRTTLNVGTIHGGTSVNSIPESATADLDLRSTSALQLDRTELAILQTLTTTINTLNSHHPTTPGAPNLASNPGAPEPAVSLPKGPDFRTWDGGDLHLHVTRIGDRPAAELAPGSALATSLRAVDRHLNLATDSRIGSTDANLPLSLNISALAIGAGGTAGGIHTLAEWYDPTHRDLALRRILLLLLDTCTLLSG